MDAAKTREPGLLQTGDHMENIHLRAVLHLGLEADDVKERAQLALSRRSCTMA